MSELDEFLKDSEVDDTEETTAETELDAVVESDEPESEESEAEEAEESEESEDGSTAEPEKPDTSEDDDPESSKFWAKQAYLDEKRKRQELEKRLKELEAPKQEEPSLFENPQAVLGTLKAQLSATLSREFMKELKPDYEDKEKYFVSLCQKHPELVDQLQSATNPAKFAYETAEKYQLLDEIGDPKAYRAKLEAEIREKLNSELKTSKKKPSLAKTPSVTTEADDDDSLGAILGR